MWMKIDDGLHVHRKTRAVTKSHESKRRDAAPMGLWVLAGSWAAQNATDGWVPEDELDRFDEDWSDLAERLVHTGWWWPQERNGERGYGFNDWHDYNDPADMASKAGTYGNHVRWHVNESRVEIECEHCPTEPDRGDVAPESRGDRGAIPTTRLKSGEIASPQVSRGVSGGDSGGDSHFRSGAIALPEPEPEPEPETRTPSARAVALAAPSEASAQTLVSEWIDHCAEKPPSRVIGHVAKEVKTMLDDGIAYARVRAGLAEWNGRDLHPSTLPSIVHGLANRAPTKVRGQQAADDIFERAMERAVAREAGQ